MFYLLFALVAVICVRLSTTAAKHIVNNIVYMLAALPSYTVRQPFCLCSAQCSVCRTQQPHATTTETICDLFVSYVLLTKGIPMRVKLNKLKQLPGQLLTITFMSACVYYAVYKHMQNNNVSEARS